VQQGDGLLDDVAVDTQAGAVWVVAAGEYRDGVAGAHRAPVLVVVVSAVGVQPADPPLRPAASWWVGFDLPDLVQQGQELGAVVAVAASQRHRQRDAGGVDEDVVFAAGATAVYWAGAGVNPPLSARMCEPSTEARDQSMALSPCSSESSSRCNWSHTPASVQSRNRRQHVMPDP